MGSSGNLGKKRSVWKWIKHKVRAKRQDRKTDHKQDVWSMETEPAESKTIQLTICGIDNVANVNLDNVANVNLNITYENDVCKSHCCSCSQKLSRESHTNEGETGVNLPIEESYRYVGLGGNLGYESSNDNEKDNVEGPHCSLPENPFEKFLIGNFSRKLSNTIDNSSDKLKDEKVMNIEPVAGMDHTSAGNIHDNNIANSLPFSTLVNDQSNIKHYSGSPELESQNETEDLMEDPTTIPKEIEQSVCLQKKLEHMPIPDPVAGHKETQPKSTAADVNGIGGELKSSSFEVSSGYPVQTCSDRTEIKSANLAMYSDEGDSQPSTRFSPTVQEYAVLSLTNNYKREPTSSSQNVDYCQEQDQHISTENISNKLDIMSEETTSEIDKYTDTIAPRQIEQRYTDHVGQFLCMFVSFFVIGRSMRSIYTTWCIGTAISKLMMKSYCEIGCVGDENVCNHQDQHQEEVENRNKYTYEGSKEKDAEDLFCHECLLHTDYSQSLQNRVKYHLTLPIERVECTSLENDDLCHDKLENTVKDNESEVAESVNIGATKIETVHCTDDCDSGVARENDLDCLNEDTVVEERKEDTHELVSLTSEITVVENVESNGGDKAMSSIVLFHQHLVISHTEKIDYYSGMAVYPENIKTLIEEVDVHKNRECSIADRGKDPAESDDLYQMFASITETTDDENLCNTHSHKMKESEMPQNGAVEDDNHVIYRNDNSVNKETEFDYDSERPGQGEKSRQRELASIGDQLKTVSSINPSGLMVKQCTKITFDDECDYSVLPQPGEMCETHDKEEYQSDIFEVTQQIEVISLPELKYNRGSNSIRKKCIIKKNIDQQDIGQESIGGTKCINDVSEITEFRTKYFPEIIDREIENANRVIQLQTIEKELKTGHNLCNLRKDNACILSNENIQSQNESKPDTKVKLQKKKKTRSSYFCKYCHHSRDKPNGYCFRHRPHQSSRTLEKVNDQTFKDGDEAVRSELKKTEPAVAYISSTCDSGVFSDFASTLSSYTQSYDSCMTNVKACCNTDKESTDAEQTSSKGLLLERLSLAERSLRDQEKMLKEILKAVTLSWSYFTPESFSPYLYPGLATYFERVQNGDQLSAGEHYSYEWIRFQSFDHYRGNGSGIILARNGFYHDRDAGETATRCYACDATCSDWEYFVDNAADHHRPDCPHLNRANSGNIPIQPDDGSDERVYNTAASHAGRDNATATPGAAGRDDETTTTSAASDTSTTTGTVHNNYSVSTLSRSIEQARVQSQNNEQTQGGSSAQPTQDRENEQYMSSFTAHRENTADSLVTSSHTEHRNVTFTGQLTEPANLVVSSHRGQSLPSSYLPLNQGHGACSGTAATTINQSVTSREPTTISQAAINRTYEHTTISQPVTVSEPGAVSQQTASGQAIASAIQDRPGLQPSAQASIDPRRLETTGFVQTHPELISIDNPTFGEYSTVDSRAASFTGTWPDTLDLTPQRMAEAGFFYTGTAHHTRCFTCGLPLWEWELGDDPVFKHTRYCQNCAYVNRLKGKKYVTAVMQKQRNIALSQQRAATPISQAATNRTYEPTTISQPVTVSEPGAVSQLAASSQSIASAIQDRPGLQASAQATGGPRRLETTGFVQTHPELIRIDSPRHGDYNTVDSRAASFTGTWPDTLDQTPRIMAEAGFFYTGVADFTRCFACGGGLRNWESGDDPVIEHTRWYQNCPYINRLKGEKYVKAVMLKQQQHLEERKREQQALSQQKAALPQDPLRTMVASVLVEMGYPLDRIREAIVEVRRQTGTTDVTAEQVLIWILDDDDRRNAIAARRAAGSAAFAAASTTSQAVEIFAPSTVSSTAPKATATTSASSTATASSTTSQAVEASTSSASTTALKTSSTTSGSAGYQAGTAGNRQSEEDQRTGSQHSSEGDSEGSETAGNQGGATGGATGGAEAARSENEGNPSISGGKSKRKRKRKKKKGQQRQNASLPAEGATGNSGDLAPHIAPPDTQSLREENEKLRDIQTCKICLNRPVDTTFLPCGHLVCCGNCATKMRKCPICRKLIKGSVKTFMS